MMPYWLLLLVLSFGSIIFRGRNAVDYGGSVAIDHQLRRNVPLLAALVAICLMIGFRYKVGGDWKVYSYSFNLIKGWPLPIALRRSPDEIGYTLVNWLVGQVGAEIWLVNLVCAIPFVVGLASIARLQPNPWLALAAAAPLFIIVVGMGYTRQATAAGFMLIALAGLSRGRGFWWFLGWTLVGSLFHQSILVFIPIIPVFLFRISAFSVLLIAVALVIGYFVILPHALERYSIGYINQIYLAKGAIFRIVPNALTAAMLLAFRRQFAAPPVELKIWRGFAYLALAIFAAFFFIPSTVILDRLSIYVLPLQFWVWSRLPTAFGHQRQPNIILTLLVIAYSAACLGLWLAFANHSRYWIPYQLYPLWQ